MPRAAYDGLSLIVHATLRDSTPGVALLITARLVVLAAPPAATNAGAGGGGGARWNGPVERLGEGPVEHAEDRASVSAPTGLMEDAAESIGTTLDEDTTCAELAGFLRRRVCEAAAVDLLPEDAPAARFGSGRATARVATAGRADLLAADCPDGAPAGTHSMTVPLVAHARRYGELVAVRTGAAYTAQEITVMHHAARLAAVNLGHARKYAAVQSAATNLQRALLAEPGRPHANLDVATSYLPAGGSVLVGGDWLETVRLHFGRTLLVMGDVMGHGLDAAVDMSAYRSLLRYIASTDLPPHRVLRQLDAAAAEEHTRRPATCLLVQVDPARGTAALVSAGHLPPVRFGADGTGTLLRLPVGPPLGTGVGGYQQTTCALAPDQTLVMFTDGLVERRREDIDESLARLAGLRLPPGAGVQETLDFILDRLDAQNAEDDVAVLTARIRRSPAADGLTP